MKRDPYKFQAKSYLEESGYTVHLIEEDPNDKRADLLASCETDSLIVEVKCKYDDDELFKQLMGDPFFFFRGERGGNTPDLPGV